MRIHPHVYDQHYHAFSCFVLICNKHRVLFAMKYSQLNIWEAITAADGWSKMQEYRKPPGGDSEPLPMANATRIYCL